MTRLIQTVGICILFWGSAYGQLREVEVCVLNDSRAPVQDLLITELLDYASDEFAQNVSISFQEVERHGYPLDIFLERDLQLEQIRQACSRGEVAVIFSHQVITAAQWHSHVNGTAQADGPKGNLLGLSNTAGYAMLTSIHYGLNTRDATGKPKIYGTIKHELGHLFYPGHLESEHSFLYQHGNRFNQWTDETRRVIDAARHRQWQLSPAFNGS